MNLKESRSKAPGVSVELSEISDVTKSGTRELNSAGAIPVSARAQTEHAPSEDDFSE